MAGAAVVQGGGVEQVEHLALVLEDEQRDDVAGGARIFRKVENTFQIIHISELPGKIAVLGEGAVAEVGQRTATGDMPAAPAPGERCRVGDNGGAKVEQRVAALVGEDGPDHHAGDVLGARGGVAGHTLVRIPLDARLAFRSRIHDIKYRTKHGILHDHFDRTAWHVSDVGVFREKQRARVAGPDERVLQAGFRKNENL